MIAILIQARLNSERLPEKALLPLGDSTVLGQVIRRAKKSGLPVVVVSQDQPIIDIAVAEGVEHSKLILSERNVLKEMYHAARMFEADTIVRLTGDCPCVSPREINQMVGFYQEELCDIMCNHSDVIQGLGIDGLDIEVFSFAALRNAHYRARSSRDREHVTAWMYDNLRSQQVGCLWDFDAKLSIDTQEDYERVYDIYETLGNDFETRDLIGYFKEERK